MSQTIQKNSGDGFEQVMAVNHSGLVSIRKTAEGYARDYANKFHSPGWVIRMELAKDVALIAITAHNVKRLSTFNIPNLNFAMGVQNGVISRNSTFEFDRVFAQNLCARFPDLAGYLRPKFLSICTERGFPQRVNVVQRG